KPFNIMELKARIRALLRRSTGARRREQESSRIACGDFVLDMGQRVALCGGRVVDLTAKEYDLLE
ncbi:MAG TPA: DNA-binding response regulator, partial [Oscillibacter sp.]|nr:DNA-binding response regulator [Oscillibacter sp.]